MVASLAGCQPNEILAPCALLAAVFSIMYLLSPLLEPHEKPADRWWGIVQRTLVVMASALSAALVLHSFVFVYISWLHPKPGRYVNPGPHIQTGVRPCLT